jgi:ubiquinone/menaquinone biosynthesis C-methylase UbiE
VKQPEDSTFDRIAAPYDRGMALLETLWLKRMRGRLLPEARGRVLEVGVGTGANFDFYPPTVSLVAIDESPDMLEVAARRAQTIERRFERRFERPICLSNVDVEHLPFPRGSFDTVVSSLVLCSVVDQPRALAELHRVLRPAEGKLLLLEHMRPQARPWTWLIDLANMPWYGFNKRCHLNRTTQQAVAQAGFLVERAESKLNGFLRLIVARAT